MNMGRLINCNCISLEPILKQWLKLDYTLFTNPFKNIIQNMTILPNVFVHIQDILGTHNLSNLITWATPLPNVTFEIWGSDGSDCVILVWPYAQWYQVVLPVVTNVLVKHIASIFRTVHYQHFRAIYSIQQSWTWWCYVPPKCW